MSCLCTSIRQHTKLDRVLLIMDSMCLCVCLYEFPFLPYAMWRIVVVLSTAVRSVVVCWWWDRPVHWHRLWRRMVWWNWHRGCWKLMSDVLWHCNDCDYVLDIGLRWVTLGKCPMNLCLCRSFHPLLQCKTHFVRWLHAVARSHSGRTVARSISVQEKHFDILILTHGDDYHWIDQCDLIGHRARVVQHFGWCANHGLMFLCAHNSLPQCLTSSRWVFGFGVRMYESFSLDFFRFISFTIFIFKIFYIKILNVKIFEFKGLILIWRFLDF